PAGHVYVGGTDYLYRMPKVGGPATDVEALAGLSTSQLGYAMVIAGSELFLLESKLSGTTGHVWRISTDNGSTWNVVDYATFPQQPEDWIRAGVAYKGKLYAMIEEWTSTVPTEIWEMD